jgi:hypothetical protein
MKKIIYVLFVTIINVIVFGQNTVVQNNDRDNFEKMTFEVLLNKSSFVISEPIFINFKISNQTESQQKIYAPDFIRESKLKVISVDKTLVFDHLSPLSVDGISFPAVVPPNWTSFKDEMFNSSFTGYFFPESGKYKLQFVLHNPGMEKFIESNIIEITIEKPNGINKDALDFMTKHQDFFGLSSWAGDGKNSLVLLEEFVSKYSQSAYGELAISSLADMYKSKNDLSKAQTEFEKIKTSDNKLIADEATKALGEIKARKICLEKTKAQKP